MCVCLLFVWPYKRPFIIAFDGCLCQVRCYSLCVCTDFFPQQTKKNDGEKGRKKKLINVSAVIALFHVARRDYTIGKDIWLEIRKFSSFLYLIKCISLSFSVVNLNIRTTIVIKYWKNNVRVTSPKLVSILSDIIYCYTCRDVGALMSLSQVRKESKKIQFIVSVWEEGK